MSKETDQLPVALKEQETIFKPKLIVKCFDDAGHISSTSSLYSKHTGTKENAVGPEAGAEPKSPLPEREQFDLNCK